ncbi:flagellar hook-basal body complex protein [Clostridium ganghwense]|uniref:Flagellar hook-basal body complex protein n=1 Tax=Clostridium ganghwense TaxID=312089 RepID=A0ABT4CMU5_9CLOT|nr:flagellar hook-basal body complex protein [Clostridium ganghwense]MCY6370367.1 flagellar hook-basal body complex protein [Clostridium ganghwense]
MIRSIWNSRSGMSAQMEKLDTISNNMSNISTPGYKRIDVSFESLVQETLKRDGYPTKGNVSEKDAPFTGTGVRTTGIYKDNSQGTLTPTNNNTDLAIDGEGYFKVIDGNGNEAYSRSGSFSIDSNGVLVDSNGNTLVILDENGQNINTEQSNVQFQKASFKVDEQGNILGNTYGNLRIPVFNTTGQNSMKSIGENLYSPEMIIDDNGNETQSEVYMSENADVLQGFIENSNVEIGKEMADLIITQRAFQLNSSALKTADEMWQMSNNLKGR